ncbi:type II secretion system F family protein [soil metagenome]
MEPTLVIGGLTLLAGAAALGAGVLGTRRSGDDAVAFITGELHGVEADDFSQRLDEPFVTRVIRPLGGSVAGRVGALLPSNHRERIQSDLLRAGLAGRYRTEEVVATQVVLGLGSFLIALILGALEILTGTIALTALIGGPVIGVLLPQVWLSRHVEDRRGAILKDLPDICDLLAISVEAGMGFEGALDIVCQRFTSPLADELSRTLKEMELGLARKEALTNLKRRTEVPELSNFILALVQADALGMPIGRVLKTQAGELRLKRRQWAREKASKLPVKILFPLILFIFPAVLVVVLGPAVSEIGKAF